LYVSIHYFFPNVSQRFIVSFHSKTGIDTRFGIQAVRGASGAGAGAPPPTHAPSISTPFVSVALFVRLISHRPAVFFSQNKLATSNQSAVLFSHSKSAPARVHLTGGNRPGYRPGPVSVPAGYQPGVFKFFGFEFKKLKNEEKCLKIVHDLLSLMVSIFFANFVRLV
jgi:hypothetical protein